MDLFELNSSVYEVRLNGVMYTNCSTDADCPGAALCAINQTWAAFPQMCYCDFVYNHIGASCTEVGPYGWLYFSIHLIDCIMTSSWCLVGLYDLMLLVKWGRFKRDAVSTSLVLSIGAAISLCLLMGTEIRFIFQSLPPDAITGSKSDQSPLSRVLLAFTFFFCTSSMMNISLVWIEIAENAEKMKMTQDQNVHRYRKFLLVYYLFFLGLIVVSLSLDNEILAAAAALPGIFFIVCTYTVGFIKMRRMLQVYLTPSGNNSDDLSVNKDAKQLRTAFTNDSSPRTFK